MAWHEATKEITCKVTYQCESCGEEAEYEKTITLKGGGSRSHLAREALQKKIRDFDKNTAIDSKPCPHCGYTQSWMASTTKFKLALIGVVVSGLIFTVAAAAWLPNNREDWAFCIGPSLALLVGFLIFRFYEPNRGRSTASIRHEPTITTSL